MKPIRVVPFAFFAILLAMFAGTGSASTSRLAHGRPGFIGHGVALNWAGYAASGATFSEVHGNWTHPGVECAHNDTSFAAFFVGLDGNTSNTVEQIGTEADCVHGTEVDFAWYELFPDPPVTLPSANLPVSEGDSISASVAHDTSTCPGSDNFELTITNTTQSKTYTTCASIAGAELSSAEWIAESPAKCVNKCSRILPLANFASVGFTGAGATGDSTTGAIDNAAWDNEPITMVTKSLRPRATPGDLADTPDTSGTSAFTIAWNSK